MIKMINRLTGTEMWVADNRVNEYTEAGHKLASDTDDKPTEKKPKVTRKTKK